MSMFIHTIIYTLVLCESHLKEKLATPLEIMQEQVCLIALKKIIVLEMKYSFQRLLGNQLIRKLK